MTEPSSGKRKRVSFAEAPEVREFESAQEFKGEQDAMETLEGGRPQED